MFDLKEIDFISKLYKYLFHLDEYHFNQLSQILLEKIKQKTKELRSCTCKESSGCIILLQIQRSF